MSTEEKVSQWIRDAVTRGASDIHFEPDKGGKMRVRVRVDGSIKTVETGGDASKILSRLKIMADLDVNEKNVPLDGRIRADKWVSGLTGIDLRMSTLPCMGGEKGMRYLGQPGIGQILYHERHPVRASPREHEQGVG